MKLVFRPTGLVARAWAAAILAQEINQSKRQHHRLFYDHRGNAVQPGNAGHHGKTIITARKWKYL